MNVDYFAPLMAIALVTQLTLSVTHAQPPQLESIFNDALVEHFSPSSSPQVEPPPPNRGAPRRRIGGGTSATQSPMKQLVGYRELAV